MLRLAGEPIKRQSSQPPLGVDPSIWSYSWYFGRLRYHSDAFPIPLLFEVVFQAGRVASVEDPFAHMASANGRPVVPHLLSPPNESKFSHYPRWLDLRWRPWMASNRLCTTWNSNSNNLNVKATR